MQLAYQQRQAESRKNVPLLHDVVVCKVGVGVLLWHNSLHFCYVT